QQAWGVRAQDLDTTLGNLPHLQLATFIVPRPLLRSWSAYDALPEEVMFPGRGEDSGLRYWLNAKEKLESVGLLPYPSEIFGT
ncbi:MAG: hypothetical protein H7X80_09145, partial [bacterium]|nr:hypothetical protein [Candidatus Kapabacteria bacterium]